MGGKGVVRLKLMDDDDGGAYKICHFSIINRAEVLLSSLLIPLLVTGRVEKLPPPPNPDFLDLDTC